MNWLRPCYILTWFLCVGYWLNSADAQAEKPNIVLILTDDLGINDLSCYGRKDQPTPNLDKLAAQGIRFTSAYCAQPICSPSRAAILTGKSPARLHLTNFLPGRADAPSQKLLQPIIEGQLPLEETTLAEVLREAGYATACIGKWHLGGAGFGPAKQGFQFAFSGKADTRPSAKEGGKGEYELTASAERWIEENRSGPFFLYLAHNTPHIPLAAKPELIEKHRDAWNPIYAAIMETLDDSVGRILAKLEELALTSKTIVIFASDNGGLHVLEAANTPATYNAPFRAGKGYLTEGGLRVPLIICWPGHVKEASVSEFPVVLTDLTPTLLDAAGIDSAKSLGPLDGRSLVSLLEGGMLPPKTLYWHFPNYTNQGGRPGGAIRDGEWKLILDDETNAAELYRLSDDLGEAKNLAGQEPERTEAMRAKLVAWRESVGAQGCRPNPEFDPALHEKIYVATDTSRLPFGSREELQAKLEGWRSEMNQAVKGRAVRVTPGTGDIRLLANAATVHGTTARYEPQSNKNTIGFWTKPEDWVSWDFDVPKAGRYEVEIQQGCNGGGSEVVVEVGGQTLAFTVQGTGHFQNFILRTIGAIDLGAGKATLAVKPRSKQGAAVMDLRRVVLRPVP
jgi:arylsulfatase A-like enzyme